jgi:hypothetical protein
VYPSEKSRTNQKRALDPTLPMVLPRNERTPTSGGKLVGVLVCDGEDMRPDLASSSAKWNPPKNRLPKMPKDMFSVGVRYHALPGKHAPRVLVQGTAQSPDMDEFAFLLQPIKDTRRNYRCIAGKLIQL